MTKAFEEKTSSQNGKQKAAKKASKRAEERQQLGKERRSKEEAICQARGNGVSLEFQTRL